MTDVVDRGNEAQLLSLEIADEPGAWAAAGFDVDGDRFRVGATTVHLVGGGGRGRGISSATVTGLGAHDPGLDGLDIRFVEADEDHDRSGSTGGTDRAATPTHPNGVTGFDHLVVATPELDRTIAALGDVGLACRRIRETTSYGSRMRQAFFRIGDTILEVVSDDGGPGQTPEVAPAAWFGIALDVDDLDRTADLLGEGLGTIRTAVQDGRRIATIRHKAFGLSVAVALMDDHDHRTVSPAAPAEPADPGG